MTRLARDGPVPVGPLWDVVGVLLVVAAVGWAVLVARSQAADASAIVLFGSAAVAAYVLAGTVGQVLAWAPPAAVVLGTAVLTSFPVDGLGTYRSGLAFGPLSYANASASLYLLAAVAGAMLVRLTPSTTGRLVGVAATAATAVAVVASGSVAATVLLGLPAIALFVRGPRATRILLAALGIGVLIVVASTWVLALRYAPASERGGATAAASRALSAERLTYWSEALTLAREHPVTGVGPGRFRHLAPSARHDVDAVAVHNDHLQAAAELGLPGAVLLAGLLAWGFVRLSLSAELPASGLAGSGLAGLAVQAAVDYVLHAPAVLVALVMVVAAGTCGTRPSQREPLTGQRGTGHA